MRDNLLLSSNGFPLRSFGGDEAFRQFNYRGYVISLEPVEGEPAMVIWPASASFGGGAYAVCMSAFPHWIELDGRPTAQAFVMATKGLRAMNVPTLDIEIKTLVDVVMRHIPDVLRMPNRRRKDVQRDRMFQVQTKVDGKTISEASV